MTPLALSPRSLSLLMASADSLRNSSNSSLLSNFLLVTVTPGAPQKADGIGYVLLDGTGKNKSKIAETPA